jgi:CRP-like cAMP-binding protein
MFIGFSEMMIKTFVNYLRPVKFKFGEYVKEQSRELDHFYILFKGSCKIVIEVDIKIKIED